MQFLGSQQLGYLGVGIGAAMTATSAIPGAMHMMPPGIDHAFLMVGGAGVAGIGATAAILGK